MVVGSANRRELHAKAIAVSKHKARFVHQRRLDGLARSRRTHGRLELVAERFEDLPLTLFAGCKRRKATSRRRQECALNKSDKRIHGAHVECPLKKGGETLTKPETCDEPTPGDFAIEIQ